MRVQAGAYSAPAVMMTVDKVKGIVVIVWKDEDMPRDELGTVADIVVDPTAVTKRTIAGRTLHAFIAGGMRDIRIRYGKEIGIPLGADPSICMDFVNNNPQMVEDLFNKIMEVRKAITPDSYRAIMEPDYAEYVKQRELYRVKQEKKGSFSILGTVKQPRIYSVMEVEVLDFLINGLNIELQPDNEIPIYTVAKIIRDRFCPQYGHLTFRMEGREYTTSRPAMIGSLYQILLDKTGFENAAVASGKTQHFGMAAKITNNERRSYPVRQQPTRSMGEAETENEVAVAGPKFTYELLESTNSPYAHKKICEAIIHAKEPTKLTKVIGNSKADDPISRALEHTHHILWCAGHTLNRDKL